jgi:hypothetical protein
MNEKLERRLRWLAKKLGYRLRKSRIGYDTYSIIEADGKTKFPLTLEEAEQFLNNKISTLAK